MPQLKQSYVRSACDVPLISNTVAKRWGERLALAVRHQGVSWTYYRTENRVADLAASLLALDSRTRPLACL